MVSKWIFLSQKYCVYVIQPSNKKKALEKEKLNKSLVKNWKHMFTYPGRKKGWNFHDCCHYHQISADTPHASEFYRKNNFLCRHTGSIKVTKGIEDIACTEALALINKYPEWKKCWNFHDCYHCHQISADILHASGVYRNWIFDTQVLKMIGY